MDTKRFSQEDLAPGMYATKAQTGNGYETKEQNSEKKEVPTRNFDSNSGKRVAATAGVALAGGATVGAAAMVVNDYLNFEDEVDSVEEVVEEKIVPLKPKSESEPTPSPQSVEEVTHEIDIEGDGIAEIKGVDINGDGSPDIINGDLNGDGEADVEITSVGHGVVEHEMKIDLDGDGNPDIIVHASEDEIMHAEILNTEHVSIIDDGTEPKTLGEPVAVVVEDPDEILNDDPVVPSELDDNGDLLAQEFEDDGIGIDSVDGLDSVDDMNLDIDMA